MDGDEKRAGGERRRKKDRRSNIDTRSDDEKRLIGERRTNTDRRSRPDRRSDVKKADHAVDAELKLSLRLSMKEAERIFSAGGDLAERKFMECCWCLWKANGAELVEPFVDATFNKLPAKSRAVLFQRMLTIVYVAQEIEIKNAIGPGSQ